MSPQGWSWHNWFPGCWMYWRGCHSGDWGDWSFMDNCIVNRQWAKSEGAD